LRKIFKNKHSSSYEKTYYKRKAKQVKEEHKPSKTFGKEKEKQREGNHHTIKLVILNVLNVLVEVTLHHNVPLERP